jgi:hypothetical protein
MAGLEARMARLRRTKGMSVRNLALSTVQIGTRMQCLPSSPSRARTQPQSHSSAEWIARLKQAENGQDKKGMYELLSTAPKVQILSKTTATSDLSPF